MSPTVILHQPQRDLPNNPSATEQWLRFEHPQKIVVAQRPSEVAAALAAVEAGVAEGLHGAGFISYEAAPAFDEALVVRADDSGFPLLWFGLYDGAQVTRFDALATDRGSYQLGDWQLSASQVEFEAAIARIKSYIASGDTFQVNYTFRLKAEFAGDPWALFLALMHLQPGNYAAFIDLGDFAICSASPELFFTRVGETFTAKPMKGTAERGWWTVSDRAQATALQASLKNRAENVMIVDMLRNDLGRIATPGTVRVPSLFDLERYPTLWQMTSTVMADSPVGLGAAMAALFPCASITGAPKPRTMEIIRDLEDSPRRIYCGTIGHWAPATTEHSPQAQFNVAIRTVLIDRARGEAEYGVGSGIVWDSEATAEYEECCLKTAILRREKQSFELLETLLWEKAGGYFLLDYHLRRLQEAADYFGYPFNPSQINQVLGDVWLPERQAEIAEHDAKVRLFVDAQGQVRAEVSPWKNAPQTQPVRCCLNDRAIATDNPFLYHKTTHRQLYKAARAAHPHVDEVILWNDRGEICEACIANVVLNWQGDLITPPVSAGLLPGTFRAWLLDQGKIREQSVTIGMLQQVSQFYLINSLRQWQTAVLVAPPSVSPP